MNFVILVNRVGQIKYRISHLVDKVLIRRGIMR
jgi:hypothetical protein